ncbi:MAG TPA: serine/threonine protein phosphatase, partial [Deltaproteobacteria bacterium]|nr:serine/threonine protein phosphatase [Deltaproteobacteria bacterium]
MSFPDLERVKHLTLNPGMKLIVMSDMHRGDGTGADDFAHNSLIFRCALEYYLEKGFTYIELGDAEELWENDNFDQIYITHTAVYELLAKFHDPDPEKTRYLKVWG